MTHTQYINFQKLPTVEELVILKRNQSEMDDYEGEMQRSIDRAFEKSTSHIKRLSEEL